jgi:hypothetical protein
VCSPNLTSPAQARQQLTWRAWLPCRSFFKINRDSPEAKANQLEWAREQMELEVPEQTVAGKDIEGREDFVRQACDS